MGQVLYRKYRSRAFDEVAGQDHITSTLKRALEKNAVAHAYLFTGPRGVGKTSVARLLAHAVNELAYETDSNHLDIIEIDAASNRRIDEIRDLREKARLAPVSARYKVYIIDEVHMLTKEAFNALLKTLEEPPEHVIFILATTEAHKVPETITSRTQRFSFRPIDKETMVGHLRKIAKKEDISIDDGALTMVSEHAYGSFRDALSILDQLKNHKEKIDEAIISDILGVPPQHHIAEILDSFAAGDLKQCFISLENMLAEGVTPESAARSLSKECRDRIMQGGENMNLYLPLIEKLLNVESSNQPLLRLESAIAGTITVESVAAESNHSTPHAEKTAKPAKNDKNISPQNNDEPAKTPENKVTFSAERLLELAKKQGDSLGALLRAADISYSESDNVLHLKFRFEFHAKQMRSAKQNEKLKRILSNFFDTMPEINIVQDNSAGSSSNEENLSKIASVLDGEIVSL